MPPDNILKSNIVDVTFFTALTQVKITRRFDLCNPAERREMGRLCSLHQATVGNMVISEVITAEKR